MMYIADIDWSAPAASEIVCRFGWLWEYRRGTRELVPGVIRMNFDEAVALWSAAQKTMGAVVEVGSYRGGSTLLLRAARNNHRELYSVDIRDNIDARVASFLEVADKRHLHRIIADSRTWQPPTIYGCLFVDGDHELPGMLADVRNLWGDLRPVSGGPAIACFHDYRPGTPGVKKTVDALVSCGAAQILEYIGSLAVCEKTDELPPEFGEDL